MHKKITIKFVFAIIVGKTYRFIIRKFLNGMGSNYPGSLMIKICPDVLSYFTLPKIVIAVTGSNGKTSTSNYINDILINSGYQTINNSEGSNMPAGITTTLMINSNIFGKNKKDVAIFEIDERASSLIYKHIKPDYLVCTNLFRDSIFRNGHSEFIFSKINEKLPETTTLILNADDLISINIGSDKNKKIFYGVDKAEKEEEAYKNIVCDASTCPICKSILKFKYLHYNHIGETYCTNCSFKSPAKDFLATNIDFVNKTFDLENKKNKDEKNSYEFDFDSIYNVYNITAAITICLIIGIPRDKIYENVKKLKLKSTRKDQLNIEGYKVTKLLSKNQNPISCSQTMEFVSKQKELKTVILAITDPKADKNKSEDISWIYDTDLEYLNKEDVQEIIVLGTRSEDVVLRLLLAGVKRDIIKINTEYENVNEMIDYIKSKNIYILHSLYAEPIAKQIMDDIKEKVEKINV